LNKASSGNDKIQTISSNQENLNYSYVASKEELNTATKNIVTYESYVNDGFNSDLNNRLASESNISSFQEEKFSI
jgi:hypothetical protein